MTTISGPKIQLADNALMDEAREFLDDNKGCLTILAEDMGIPVRFFYDLTSGRVKNPGVRPIEKILRYKAMSGKVIQFGQWSM